MNPHRIGHFVVILLFLPFFAATCVGGVSHGVQTQSPAAPADLVVVNAKVLTMDSSFTIARALAIRSERFVAVGTDTEIRKLIGPATRVIDARGKTVVPGIIESHSHAISVARVEATNPYEEMSSLANIQEWVRRAAGKRPEGSWIVIPRAYPTRLRERRFPTRAELDAAAPNHAVVFDGAYLHILNSAAMQKAGIRKDTPNPKVGEIARDARGEPTGLLRNARSLISGFLPSPKVSDADVKRHVEKIHEIYSTLGITSLMERGGSVDDYRIYESLRAEGRLRLRTRFTLRFPTTSPDDAERALQNFPIRPSNGDAWLSAGPLKITVDGGILIGNAYMREPYGASAMALFNLTDPNDRGSLSLAPETITALITTGHRMGWQMSSHVTGDAGVDLVLDAVEAAGKVRPIEHARYNLIHAYFPNPTAVQRAGRLRVCVDTQPAWFYKDADALLPALGKERMERFIGVREWLNAGVPVIANTDHMMGTDPDQALNPFNPFLTMYVLVTRKTKSGQVIGAKQRVTRLEALRMMTRDAAYMTFDEDKKGSIEVRKLADLAILTDDYLNCAEEKIPRIRSETTIVAGRVIHQRK